MSDKGLRDLRKQLRNVVLDLLPEVLNSELVTAANKDVTAKLESRLDAIQKHLMTTLSQIEQRQKDTQTYVMRNIAPKV